MSRRRRERWLEAEELWPNLQQFLGCYFHEDRALEFGTLDATLERALEDRTLEGRQIVLKEWRDWNAKLGWRDAELAASIQDSFGVNLHFESAAQARKFMNWIYDKLIESVRSELGRKWQV